MSARLPRFIWIGQLIVICALIVAACNGGITEQTLTTPTQPMSTSPIPPSPIPSPDRLHPLPVVQVKPNENEKSIKRPNGSETINQNNCGNTNPLNQTIERHLKVTHTAEVGGGIKLSADGKVSVGLPLEIAGAEISMGSEIAAHYGVTYGSEEVQIRSLNLVTNGGANQEYTVDYVENWNTGTITLTIGTWAESLVYEFYTSAGIEQSSSKDLGCPTPTATVTPTAEPTPSETPAIPTEVALIAPTPTLLPAPTETATPMPERRLTVSFYTVKSGDTLSAISLLFTGSVNGAEAIRGANDIGTLHSGNVLSIPVYIVQPGDTIGILSQYFGVPVSAIVEGNNLLNPDLINSGQVLVIPVNCQSSEHC